MLYQWCRRHAVCFFDRELLLRDGKRIETQRKAACTKVGSDCLEDVDNRAGRGTR